MRVARSGGVGDWVLAVCLFLVEVFACALGTLVVVFELIGSTTTCSQARPDTCGYRVADLTLPTYWVACGLIAIGTIFWIVLRGRARKPVWWIPAVGSAIVIAVIVVLLVVNFAVYR
ncbi:hypothetical protein EDF39_3071 [Frondihabitans sp. PhB161]|nr:hypothetical protein EDF37_3003 [Frondihabitans sp. PhB153]RPF02692.1 hypothetical protein EDF39_3071 [Frondihabitans sp. PhB161]